MCDLLSCAGAGSHRPSDANVPGDIELPKPTQEHASDVEGEHAVNATLALEELLLEEAANFTLTMSEAVSDVEVLVPLSLANARHRSNWPERECNILEELATLAAVKTWDLVNW